MALITCWKCEKKYSDTVDCCIHCGASNERPRVLDVPKSVAEGTEGVRLEALRGETPKYRDFFSYSEDQRSGLEKEFWEHDTKAFKWRRVELENKEFVKSWITLYIFSSVLFYISLLIGFSLGGDNVSIFTMVYFVGVVLADIWATIGVTATIITKIRVNFSVKSLLYLKKFQKWLLEEKMIKFIPRFNTRRKKEAFDALDLKYTDF